MTCASSSGRSPYGERGLKCEVAAGNGPETASLSLRRAWIEILGTRCHRDSLACRSPYGERGLKYFALETSVKTLGRSPYGERGLKSERHVTFYGAVVSLSLRRAWIEMTSGLSRHKADSVALLTESVD